MNKINYLCLLFVLLFFPVVSVFSQEITVSGTVTDTDGNTMPGVSVSVEGKTIGTITDLDGNYSIGVEKGTQLVFSFVGYTSQKIKVGNQAILNVTLGNSTVGLDEVVVVGYAQQSRAKVISSVSSVKNEELRNIPSVNAVQALQGKIAGAVIPVTSGQPGQTARIIIRGGTTLDPYSEATPLYIVDGVFRNMDDINPDDIESIQIMKDAASTAIYGARASNGVVVIKTKTGKAGSKARVTFRYQHGIDTQARKYDEMSGRDYLQTMRRVIMRGYDNYDVEKFLYVSGNSATVPTFKNPGDYGKFKFTPAYMDNLVAVEGQGYVDNLLANGWETMDDPAAPGKTIIFKDSHYQDVLWNTAHSNNYNVGVNGGTEKANYNISLGYIDQGGVFLGTGYKRFSGLTNAGFKVSERLKVDVNFSYLWNDNKYSDDETRDLIRSVRVPPLNRLYNDDGTPNLGESNNPRNRLHQLYYQDNNVNTTRVIARMGVEYKILEGLYFRPSASVNTELNTRMNFERYYPQQTRPRDKDQYMSKKYQIMTDHVLQYSKDFKDHSLMGLVGFNYTQNNEYWVRAQSQRSATDYIATITGDPASSLINGVVTPNMTASSSFSETKSASIFAQASYDYKNTYLLAASIRRDGFSNFAPENRFAIFPSVSAGWNVHNEPFWKESFMNQLKVRASWGRTGLSDLDMADTYGTYSSEKYNTYSGILRKNLPNPSLLWETTDCYDAGIDMSMFDYRFKVVLDVYNKLTKNRLTTYPLPGETGFKDIKYNVGSLRNRGIEIELQAKILDINGFTWDSNFSFAFNRTVIVKLPENGRDKNRIDGGVVFDPKTGKEIEAGGYAEGERPQGLWAFKSNGIFSTEKEAEACDIDDTGVSAGKRGLSKHAGDVNWADLNGDKKIDGKDLVFMGYKTPDKTGGWQNTFSYKGLSLRVAVDYALGHVISDGATARAMGSSRAYNEGCPALAMSSETWQKEGDIAKYPRYSFGDFDIGYRNHQRQISTVGYKGMGHGTYGVDNSIYYSKGDYLAFREISLSYALPKQIVKFLTCENIVLNAGVYNLGYITAYKGLNPEVYTGTDTGGYPRPRQFTIGASVTF